MPTGHDRPDASTVHDVESLLGRLRELRVAAGNPSLAVLSRRTDIPRTTLHDALSPKRSTLPAWDLVRKIAQACGCTEAEVRQWGAAWRRAAAPPPAPRSAETPRPPRQLPAPPRLFTGRDDKLAELDSALHAQSEGGPVVVSAIGGIGGIGKTWLAVRWAYDHLADFPDGQLYFDLRGFDATEDPTPPAVALRSFLDALGVEAAALPSDPEAAAALFRSLVAGKRMLIVLDNARDTRQVTALLPGTATVTVLVTSRNRLTGLVARHGALAVALDVLGEAEAKTLLTRYLGPDRLAAEPEAAARLLQLCGGLPLAIGIIAARAAAHPAFPLAALVEELESARLDALGAGDLGADVRAVFASSISALGEAAARVFRLLGLSTLHEFGVPAVAALADLPDRRANALLRELAAAHLISEPAPGRFRMHDLVRLYATEVAVPDDDALCRLVDFYLYTVVAGEQRLSPTELARVSPPEGAMRALSFVDGVEAMSWFLTERDALSTVVMLSQKHGWHLKTAELTRTVHSFYARSGHDGFGMPLDRAGLAAAQRLGDISALAVAERNLGRTLTWMKQYEEGMTHLRRSLSRFEELGDQRGQATAHNMIGWAYSHRHQYALARPHAQRALEMFQKLGDARWTAAMLNAVGWTDAHLGRLDPAWESCERALALCREHEFTSEEPYVLHSIGFIHFSAGRYTSALSCYHEALDLIRRGAIPVLEVTCLTSIGDVHLAMDDPAAALQVWDEAMRILQSQHRIAEIRALEEKVRPVLHGE